MKTIKKANEKISAFIYTKNVAEKKLRDSTWTIAFSLNDVHLLKNTFSGEVVCLSDEEVASLEKVEELKQHRFIVPLDYNEAEQYQQTIKLLKLMEPEEEGLKTYTILPTTACNARCTYCYEEGYAVNTMTQATAERLVDFICETRREGKISLSWFGGEPLVGAGIIDYVCAELDKRKVDYKSGIITNASLFTPELVNKAKKDWKVERVQISLDGDKTSYAERKRYSNPEIYNYDAVMNAIHWLADEGIKVQLRVNFDKENFMGLSGFIDEMEERFGKYDNVNLYLSLLFQEQHKQDCMSVYEDMFNLYQEKKSYNVLKRINIGKNFKANHCMADSLDKSIVIDPEGRFFNCEHLPGNDNTWGNIFDGVTDKAKFDKLLEPAEIEEECKTCPFLPECTPFYRKHCPDHFDYCREYRTLKTEYELRRIAETLQS